MASFFDGFCELVALTVTVGCGIIRIRKKVSAGRYKWQKNTRIILF